MKIQRCIVCGKESDQGEICWNCENGVNPSKEDGQALKTAWHEEHIAGIK